MTWFSIRGIRSLCVVAVVLLLADHVHAQVAESPDGRIAGVVLDGKGRPLADHRVELRVPELSGRVRAVLTFAKTMTDAAGRFAFTGLAPGTFEVTVLRHDTVVRTSAPIQLSAGAMDHTVTLSESAGVSFSFDDLRTHVEPGASVLVTDTSGKVTAGTIEDVSPSSLTLLVDGVRRELQETQVKQITHRHGSQAKRGALIGLGTGVGAGLAFVGIAGGCNQDPECSGTMFAAVLYTAALGTAAGTAIGWSIRKSDVIFLAPLVPESARLTLSPIASKTRRGVALSISF
jgi:hypothetical protein